MNRIHHANLQAARFFCGEADAMGGGMKGQAMRIQLTCAEVRSWQQTDAESLTANANNRKIWRNLRDIFPSPYSMADASAFIRSALTQVPESQLAISVDGQAVGGIGFVLHDDVERVSAEIGYWLGEPYWGRGIMTEAVQAVTNTPF
jgi:[ribosomal protein S5]-alanine N-acetyltransferase